MVALLGTLCGTQSSRRPGGQILLIVTCQESSPFGVLHLPAFGALYSRQLQLRYKIRLGSVEKADARQGQLVQPEGPTLEGRLIYVVH